MNDEEMYGKFRNLIYQGQSPWEWCRTGRQVALGTFLVLVVCQWTATAPFLLATSVSKNRLSSRGVASSSVASC